MLKYTKTNLVPIMTSTKRFLKAANSNVVCDIEYNIYLSFYMEKCICVHTGYIHNNTKYSINYLLSLSHINTAPYYKKNTI